MRRAIFAALLLAAAPAGAAAEPPLAEQPPEPVPPAPKPVKRFPPRYPREAEERNLDGKVAAIVTVAVDGSVAKVEIESVDPPEFGFEESAMECLRQWRYEPNIPGRYRVKIGFHLPDQLPPVDIDFATLEWAPALANLKLPDYPRGLLSDGEAGFAEIAFHISAWGGVYAVAMIKETTSDEAFGQASGEAVLEWWFPEDYRDKSFKARFEFRIDAGGKGVVTRTN